MDSPSEPTIHLNKIDSLQRHFLHELDISTEDAFLNYNFAPPSLKRDISILGLLHKRVLGKAHPVYQKLLPFHNEVFGSLNPAQHRFQLYGHSLFLSTRPLRFSVFRRDTN